MSIPLKVRALIVIASVTAAVTAALGTGYAVGTDHPTAAAEEGFSILAPDPSEPAGTIVHGWKDGAPWSVTLLPVGASGPDFPSDSELLQCGHLSEHGVTRPSCDPPLTAHDLQANDIALVASTAVGPEIGEPLGPGETPDPPISLCAVSPRVAYAVLTMADGTRFALTPVAVGPNHFIAYTGTSGDAAVELDLFDTDGHKLNQSNELNEVG